MLGSVAAVGLVPVDSVIDLFDGAHEPRIRFTGLASVHRGQPIGLAVQPPTPHLGTLSLTKALTKPRAPIRDGHATCALEEQFMGQLLPMRFGALC